MSMSLAQKLAADSVAAVAEGRNLQDVLVNPHGASAVDGAGKRRVAGYCLRLSALFGQFEVYAWSNAEEAD